MKLLEIRPENFRFPKTKFILRKSRRFEL